MNVGLWRPRVSNCLIWALWMQLTRGGWVCWRKSRYGWWPHAVWSLDRKSWYEYMPLGAKRTLKWWQVFWIVLFRGEPRLVKRGDL